jgi:hypothetical protein
MKSLKEIQELFLAAIVGNSETRQRVAENLALGGNGSLCAPERLTFYKDQVGASLHKALRLSFPRTIALLGADARPLLRDFIAHTPSTNPDLGEYGRQFPEFLKRQGSVSEDIVRTAEEEFP